MEIRIFGKFNFYIMNYKDQIKHPKWQKRRLEIMDKDNFSCQICGDTENTLNVHHLHYHKGRDIWDYEDWELITLCDGCHEKEHSTIEDILSRIEYIKSRGVTMFEIYSLLENIDASLSSGNDNVIHAITGDDNGAFRENEFKLLTERRERLKACCLDNKKVEITQ